MPTFHQKLMIIEDLLELKIINEGKYLLLVNKLKIEYDKLNNDEDSSDEE